MSLQTAIGREAECEKCGSRGWRAGETMSETGPATDLLLNWSTGDEGAPDDLLPIVYDERRRMARSYLRQERPNQSAGSGRLRTLLRSIDQRLLH